MSSSKSRFTLAAAVSAAVLTSAAFAPLSPALAQDKGQTAVAPKANAERDLKLSQDGFESMRAVRAARIAIFNGDIAMARKLVDAARTDLSKVKADETAMKGTTPGDLVTIDAQLMVSDNFVSTPEKSKQIANGNKKLQEGKVGEAVEALKLADVGVGVSRLLMPVQATRRHIDVAADLMGSDKYYEANLALKAAEDGLQVDTMALVEGPTAGTSAQTPKPAPAAPSAPAASAPPASAPAQTQK